MQCLSFVRIILQNSIVDKTIKPSEVLSKKLLVLILKTIAKQPEIEFVACGVDIVNLVILDKELRSQVLETVLREEGEEKITYLTFLKGIEQKQEIISISELHKKIQRQVKELEMWTKACNA